MFSNHFFAHRRNVSDAAQSYVSGLVQPIGRKNIERISEFVPECNYDAQHNLISDSPWPHSPLNRHIAEQTNKLIGGSASVLEIDESAFSKAGKESVGVARQYNGRLGKIDNCQVGVFAALSRKNRHALIGSRLYLPKTWACDAKRCEKAGVPLSERQHKTKWQLGLELVDEARAAGVEFGTVAADAVYGGSEFAHELEKRDIVFALDINSNQRVYLSDPKPSVPARKGIIGRSRHVPRTNARTISVATLAKRLDDTQQWKRVSVWKGTKGYIRIDAAAMRVYFWHVRYPYAPSLWWLVMTREIGSEEIQYSISNAPAQTSLHTLIVKRRNRYWIERSFQDSKTSVGMADYQVRKWQGWQHHITLCMLALLFMLTLKDINAEDMPKLSCADILLVMNHFLPKRILTEQDLINAINKRHQQRLNAELSALHCQKRMDRLKSKVPK